jgi:hypothetical protein
VLDFGTEQEALALTIENGNNGTLTWGIEVAAPWLTLSQISGDNPLLTQTAVGVGVKRKGLVSGRYETGIIITSNDGLEILPIRMTVPQNPQLVINTQTINLGSNTTTAPIELQNTGTGRLTWEVTETADWLEVSPTTGTTLDEVNELTMTVNPTDLPAGQYITTVMIASDGGISEVVVEIQVEETIEPQVNQAPTAAFIVIPETGDSETVFQVDGSFSTDDSDPLQQLQVRWRWQTTDAFTAWTFSKTEIHQYGSAGEQTITLEVRDSEAAVGAAQLLLTVQGVGGVDTLSVPGLGEPNDHQEDAYAIAVDTSFAAQIGNDQDSADWYQLQPTADGTITIEVTNLHPLGQGGAGIGEITVYDAALKQITRIEGQLLRAGESKALSVAVTGTETYYLVVDAVTSQVAPYQSTTAFSGIAGDITEPNDSAVQANPIGVNEDITGSIGFGADAQDWYTLVMPASGLFGITLTNLHAAEVANGTMDDALLYDADLQALASIQSSKVESGKSGISSPVLVHEGEAYYINVNALQRFGDAAHSAPYTLQTPWKRSA